MQTMGEDLDGVRAENSSAPKQPRLRVVADDTAPPPSGWLSAVTPDTIVFPLATFRGLYSTRPAARRDLDWYEFVANIAFDPAPSYAEKKSVLYFMPCRLREAPYVGKTLQRAQEKGEPTVGVMRSKSHVTAVGPAIVLDVDRDVFELGDRVRALGCRAVLYSSYSYGKPRSDGSVKFGGRVVLAGDRQWTPAEHDAVMMAINQILGGAIDLNAAAFSQCFGIHATQPGGAPPKKIHLDGRLLSIEKLVELGKTLLPPPPETKDLTPRERRRREWAEKLAAEGVPQVDFKSLSSAAHYLADAGVYDSSAKKADGEPGEWDTWLKALWVLAFVAYETPALEPDVRMLVADLVVTSGRDMLKNCGDISNRGRFDETLQKVQSDPRDNGRGSFFKLAEEHGWAGKEDGILWRAKARAEGILAAAYSASEADIVVPFPGADALPDALKGAPLDAALGAGIGQAATPDEIDANTIKPEDVVWACDFLMSVFKNVWERVKAKHQIPDEIIAEATQRSTARAREESLGGKTPVRWYGKNLDEDTDRLAAAIVKSEGLYQQGGLVMRLADPRTDTDAAKAVREHYGYAGPAGGTDENGKTDPALFVGIRTFPILSGDTDVLRYEIAKHVAHEYDVVVEILGPDGKPVEETRTDYRSFSFTGRGGGPDKSISSDLLKRALPQTLPQIEGVITAPVMPNLPADGDIKGLLDPDAGRLITTPGYDKDSGLFLAPLGNVEPVPEVPTKAEFDAAKKLLLAPLRDFPFASTKDGTIGADVGLAASVFMMLVGTNRRVIGEAPGGAVTAPKQSSGKTKLASLWCVMATGVDPAPIALSPSMEEQKKELLSHFMSGDGAMLLDNIPPSVRYDSAFLATSMSKSKVKGRLLGTNQQAEVSTRVLIAVTGNKLNLAGDVSSRFLLVALDTNLERPDLRSIEDFAIKNFDEWVVENRQKLVAAVHVVVRTYLHVCRKSGGVPDFIKARYETEGTRYSSVAVFRGATIMMGLRDPLLALVSSGDASSTEKDNRAVLDIVESALMTKAPASAYADALGVMPNQHPARARWDRAFSTYFNALTPAEQQRRYGSQALPQVLSQQRQKFARKLRLQSQRRAVQKGKPFGLPMAEIMTALDDSQRTDLIELAKARTPSAIAVARWINSHAVDSPVGGRVLRKGSNRLNMSVFWIEWL